MLVQRIAARYTVAALPPLNEPRLGRSSSALRNSERRPVEIGVRHPEGEIYFHVFRHAKRMILRIVSAFMSVVLVSLNPTSQISLTTQAA